jgi:hypothetical protein
MPPIMPPVHWLVARAWIDYATDSVSAEGAAHPDRADIGINGDLGKDRAKGVHRIAAGDLRIPLSGGAGLDRLAGACHDVAIGLTRCTITAPPQAPVGPLDAVGGCPEDGRALVGDGAPGRLLLRGNAGGADRGADRGHGP